MRCMGLSRDKVSTLAAPPSRSGLVCLKGRNLAVQVIWTQVETQNETQTARPQHPQNSPQKFLCQIMPPPEGTPQIICHPPLPPHPAQPPTRAPRVSAYTPPSPRQRQLPPPRPHSPPLISRRQPPLTPPPAPRPSTIADSACPLGGDATILYELQDANDHKTLRVVVQSTEMRDDYQFVVGFVGLYLKIDRVVCC